jgi:hypothetical protein
MAKFRPIQVLGLHPKGKSASWSLDALENSSEESLWSEFFYIITPEFRIMMNEQHRKRKVDTCRKMDVSYPGFLVSMLV